MGQGLSCRASEERGFFSAVQLGDFKTVESFIKKDPTLVLHSTLYNRNTALHIAAANGQIEILSLILDRSVSPDFLNGHKQTPLMLAAMHGKISCVTKLIEVGADIVVFDSLNGRTCLHYAAYYGHSDSLQAILSSARTSQVTSSWGYSRFVNIRDSKGATPLHLAARQRQPECVHMLLDNGALVCASTSGYGFPGSTPLHLAARTGCLGCIRELLAWGADRLQRDASGRLPYAVAIRSHHGACAALLNPSSAEPLVWPSPLKFISELDQEAKALLENALMEANREREKSILKGTLYAFPSPSRSDSEIGNVSEASDTDLCCICFDQVCTIEVQDCGHRMCARCTLSLCCHNKTDPTTSVPVCPFCRSNIVRLIAVNVKTRNCSYREASSFTKIGQSSRNSTEGSSSFNGLSAIRSFGNTGRIVAENEFLDKPPSLDTSGSLARPTRYN